MSITIQNLRIIPYGQKDTIKPVFGDTMHLTFRLADAPQAGDGYTLALDYERILLPTMRPLCAMATEYTATGTDISFTLEINTERFALWASTLKKPTPIWLQLVRVRGEEYTTILLDDILALPSVVDGANMVFPGTPLEDILENKADLVDGKVPLSQLPPIGFEQVQSDWDESDSSEPSYIRNKPADFGSQQATDAEIDARESTTHTITPYNLNYAVTAALTDSKKNSLTDAQKASAQDTLGASPATLSLTAAPTTSTVGAFGQHAIDTTTGKEYTCQGATNTGTEESPVWSYTWVDDINAKGGAISNYLQISGRGRLSIGLNDNPNDWSVYGLIRNGSNITTNTGNTAGVLLSGNYISGNNKSKTQTVFGRYNVPSDSILTIGYGNNGAKKNIVETSYNGDIYIAGGHQQSVTVIPSSTTAYTIAEGCQSHAPSSASTYTLPAIQQRIITDGQYFTRNPSTDGTGYYGWLSGTTNCYTASAAPAVGDNTYTNTALTSGAKAITALDNRTHECILTVRFSSSVLTYSFEDSAGNPITPLPLAGTIQDGSVVCFRCTWEALLGQWVIMPVMLGTYQEVTP